VRLALALATSADGECVFGMPYSVDALTELKRLAEHHRLEPAIPFARSGVALGSAAEDVEANRFLPSRGAATVRERWQKGSQNRPLTVTALPETPLPKQTLTLVPAVRAAKIGDRFSPRLRMQGGGSPMSDLPATRPSLLVRLRDSRDGQAWTQFVQVYGPVVYNFARKRGLQDADAADLTQDVL